MSRRINLSFFSYYFLRYLHLSFRLRQFRIQRRRVASIVCVLRTRDINDSHANARVSKEIRCVSAYQIKKEKVDSLLVEDERTYL